MNRLSEAGLNALAATAFVMVIAAIVAAGVAYLGLSGIESGLELASAVPAGWGKLHHHQLTEMAAALAVPATIAVGWWTFRRALAGERALLDDRRDR